MFQGALLPHPPFISKSLVFTQFENLCLINWQISNSLNGYGEHTCDYLYEYCSSCFCNVTSPLFVLFSMDSPNYAYMIEQEGESDVVDRGLRQAGNETNLRPIQSASNFRRTSPQRNSIRRNAWMRSSLRRAPIGYVKNLAGL